MTSYHWRTGKTCDVPECGSCHAAGPGTTPTSSVHLRVAPFLFACGRRMRALDAPKIDKDGKRIVYPTYAVSCNIAIVSCPECRSAIGASPWNGRLIPHRQCAE